MAAATTETLGLQLYPACPQRWTYCQEPHQGAHWTNMDLYTEQLSHLLIISGVRLLSFTGLIFTGSLCIRS